MTFRAVVSTKKKFLSIKYNLFFLYESSTSKSINKEGNN